MRKIGYPYTPINWTDGPHITCFQCGVRVNLYHKKDFESYSKREWFDHYDAHQKT